MKDALRDQLVGTWNLDSCVELPVDRSAPVNPMGERPMGIIMHTLDGYMSAQLIRSGRPNFASGGWFHGTTEEYQEEPSTYIADSAFKGDDVK
jgi:hypothetical protein